MTPSDARTVLPQVKLVLKHNRFFVESPDPKILKRLLQARGGWLSLAPRHAIPAAASPRSSAHGRILLCAQSSPGVFPLCLDLTQDRVVGDARIKEPKAGAAGAGAGAGEGFLVSRAVKDRAAADLAAVRRGLQGWGQAGAAAAAATACMHMRGAPAAGNVHVCAFNELA